MDPAILDDLKQFIAATVSQSTATLIDRIDGLDARIDGLDSRMNLLDNRMDHLEQKVDDIAAAIGDALASSNETTDAQLADHERRLQALETKTV